MGIEVYFCMFGFDEHVARWGAVTIENAFITDFLPAAKGDYVKVYLFCLHACSVKADVTMESIAKELNIAIDEVFAALRYWERRGLVTRLKENPPEYEFHSVAEARKKETNAFAVDNAYVEFSENVYSIFGARRKVSVE